MIGSGIAGASCAYHLALQGIDTVLVERESRELGTHSTGRSAATLLPGCGGEENDRLTKASSLFFESGVAGIAEHPLLIPRELLWVCPAEPEGANRDLLGATRVGFDVALAMCPALPPEAITTAAIQTGVCDIDVEGLLQALVRGAKQHGRGAENGHPSAECAYRLWCAVPSSTALRFGAPLRR